MDVHKPLGSDVILYLSVSSHSIVARVDGHPRAKKGQQIEVVFNMRKMHLFDPQTLETLVLPVTLPFQALNGHIGTRPPRIAAPKLGWSRKE